MRVLMLSKALVVGAYQRKAELLASEPDVELSVVVPPLWRDGDRTQRLERAHTRGYDLIETRIARPGSFHLHDYPHFGRVLDETRPEIVHIDEEPYNLATVMALRAARRRGALTLFFTWQNLNRRYPPPFSWMEGYVYRHADGAIAGSRTAAAVLRAKGYAGRMWHVPQFGVDAEAYRPPDDRPVAERPFTVGYAGRLVQAKGVDLLVDALAGLDGRWRLLILGEGDQQVALQTQARHHGIADRVRFEPWRPSTEMPAFYAALDALVLPSRSTRRWIEQFGRVLIEAMACGVPCVGSDSGEIPYVIGEAGLVFPEDDTAALRAHLGRLAIDPGLRAGLSAAGRARVLDRFTMARVAADTAAVYRTLYGGMSSAGRPA